MTDLLHLWGGVGVSLVYLMTALCVESCFFHFNIIIIFSENYFCSKNCALSVSSVTVYILGLLAAVVVFWYSRGGSSGRTVLTLSIKGSWDFLIIIIKCPIVNILL